VLTGDAILVLNEEKKYWIDTHCPNKFYPLFLVEAVLLSKLFVIKNHLYNFLNRHNPADRLRDNQGKHNIFGGGIKFCSAVCVCCVTCMYEL